MYLLESAFACFALILSVNAAPQAPSQLDDKTPRTPDLCGPLVQDGSTPPDTCRSDPPVVSKPSSFGILGTLANLDQADAISEFQPNWWGCNQTVMQTCAKMAASDTRAGAWYFESGPYNQPNEGDPACQIGFWLPRDDVGNADLPTDAQFKSDPTAARKPTREQCETTLGATVAKVAENKEGWVGASINLKVFPKDQPGQWRYSEETSGTEGTGATADPRYPSVLISAYQGGYGSGSCADENGDWCQCGVDGKSCAVCRYDNGNLCECSEDAKSCLFEDGGSSGDVSCLDEENPRVLVPCE